MRVDLGFGMEVAARDRLDLGREQIGHLAGRGQHQRQRQRIDSGKAAAPAQLLDDGPVPAIAFADITFGGPVELGAFEDRVLDHQPGMFRMPRAISDIPADEGLEAGHAALGSDTDKEDGISRSIRSNRKAIVWRQSSSLVW